MPVQKLKIRPGVTVELTPTLNEAGISQSRLIRFFAGLVQKIGGWLALPSVQMAGVCRGLFGWADFNGVPYLAAGTDQRLFVIAGVQGDITPIYQTAVVTNAFITLNGSPVVEVIDTGATPSVGDWINITTTLTVGGIPLGGFHQVAVIVPAPPGRYEFVAAVPATSSTGPTGNATIEYLLPSGFSVNTALTGYGAGDYGAGDYGIGSSGVPIIGYLRQWSLDQFGQDLIASPTGGAIYFWQPPTVQPATKITQAPAENLVVFVMGQAQIVVSCGGFAMGVLNPTLIQWSDSGDFTDWTPSAINQAGSYQLPTGSTVVAAVASGLGALIWTDTDLWSMVYQGLPFVFGFNKVGVNVEAISMRSPVVVGGAVVWPSLRGFFRYDGSTVAPMECAVWDIFYNNLDTTQLGAVFGGRNTLFNEAAWWFPFVGGGYGRVKWNYLENLWDYDLPGAIDRTAWTDHSPFGNPVAADLAGLLQQHETTNDANGQPINYFFRTGYADLPPDGTSYMFIDRFDPDFLGTFSEIEVTFFGQNFPQGTVNTYGPYTITPQTEHVNFQARNRRLALQIAGNDLGSFVRLGAPGIRVAPSGRR